MKTLVFDLDGTLVYLAPTLVCIADVQYLQTLTDTYQLALVSGSPREEVEYALTTTGMDALFPKSLRVCKEDTNGDKASGEPFQEIQSRLQGSMIMIGDSNGDESGTTRAGMAFVRVPSCTSLTDQKEALTQAITEACARV